MAPTAYEYESGDIMTVVEPPENRLPYEQWPFACTYVDCQHRFMTLAAMQHHKRSDPTHFYCKRCDVDCLDWEELTFHKVRTMAPYIEGTKKASPEDPPKHIVCEFCGEDFGSFGGRKRHRELHHQKEQDINCRGCYEHFTSAAAMIHHLETGKCKKIKPKTFATHSKQKEINGEIMKDPWGFMAQFSHNNTLPARDATPGLITDGMEKLDAEEGGVALLDQQDEAQQGGYKVLEAMKHPLDSGSHGQYESWPRLLDQSTSRLNQSMDSLFLKSGTSSMQSPVTATNKDVYAENYPYLTSTTTNRHDCMSTATQTSKIESRALVKHEAWNNGSTQQTLFPNTQPTPIRGDWSSQLARHRQESVAENNTNALRALWWDPTSPDYDVKRFYNPVTQAYFCPLPDCDAEYICEGDINDHMMHDHDKEFWTCPVCLKRFKTRHAMFSHVEKSTKCLIKHSKHHSRLIDELSGGYLKVESVDNEPRIYPVQQMALVKAGQRAEEPGVMSRKFTAKMPEQN